MLLVGVEAATIAIENFNIYILTTHGTHFALGFSHFRMLIAPQFELCCVCCLFFHAPHVRHFVKIAFVTLPVPDTNALDNSNNNRDNNNYNKVITSVIQASSLSTFNHRFMLCATEMI